MSTISRRGLLGRGAAVAGGAAVSTSAAQALMSRNAYAAPGNRGRAGKGDGGYGPLQPAGPELALPAGFTYVKFGVEGSIMSDGNPTPKAHDGMAALPLPNGNVRLIRNHEDRDTAANSIVKGDPSTAYDKRGGGSTTSLFAAPPASSKVMVGPARGRAPSPKAREHYLRSFGRPLRLTDVYVKAMRRVLRTYRIGGAARKLPTPRTA